MKIRGFGGKTRSLTSFRRRFSVTQEFDMLVEARLAIPTHLPGLGPAGVRAHVRYHSCSRGGFSVVRFLDNGCRSFPVVRQRFRGQQDMCSSLLRVYAAYQDMAQYLSDLFVPGGTTIFSSPITPKVSAAGHRGG